MFRLIVMIACLFIIGDYTLRLMRWNEERSQLRWMQKRIVRVDPRKVATQKAARADGIESNPGHPGFNWLGAIFMVVLVGSILLAL